MRLESPQQLERVIVKNRKRAERTKSLIRTAGAGHLHVVSDFAKTLTKEYINGERVPPVVAQLRNGNFLGPEYPPKAHELFNQYALFEKDISKGIAARNEKMLEWWRTHFELLIQSGFSLQTAKDVAAHGSTQLRDKLPQFIDFLEKHSIPLIIITATPGDLTLAYLEAAGLRTNHIHIAGNLYSFDAAGNAIDMPSPIIHPHNKGEVPLATLPFYDEIKDRRNVLLLGDSLEDLDMLKSDTPHEEVLTIGLYNKPTDVELAAYVDAYDIVLTGDGSMEQVNYLLADLFA